MRRYGELAHSSMAPGTVLMAGRRRTPLRTLCSIHSTICIGAGK
jgi:hypothetical protein